MKLLFDENLSNTLLRLLEEFYPRAAHVRNLGLKSATDSQLWAFAATKGFTIVTKDADFHYRSVNYGHPPKVIWIRLGNCSTKAIAGLIIMAQDQIRLFEASDELSFLSLP